MHIAMILQCLPGLAQDTSPQAADALVCALKCLADLALRIEACKLILSPSFFWSTLALLHSTNQAVYAEAAQLITCLLDRLDLSDHLARSAICNSAPPEWGTAEAGFKGLFPLALRGLCAERTYEGSIRLLRAVTNMPGEKPRSPRATNVRGVAHVSCVILHRMVCQLTNCENQQPLVNHHRPADRKRLSDTVLHLFLFPPPSLHLSPFLTSPLPLSLSQVVEISSTHPHHTLSCA